jgi:hypothetical protein
VRGRLLAAAGFAFLVISACGYADPYASTAPIANESPVHGSPTPGVDDFHAGDIVSVQYTGWLTDATLFDSSRSRNQPFTFTIGQGQVIPGWDEGVPGMAIGGKRKLIIPSALAYGTQGQTDPNTGATVIPPNANLVFDIQLLTVKPGPSPSPSPKVTPSPSPKATPSPSPSAKPT